jgi:hypothetical protein
MIGSTPTARAIKIWRTFGFSRWYREESCMTRSLLSVVSSCLVAQFLAIGGLALADDATALVAIDEYTTALQSGDVVALKELLGGRLFLKQRTLLEDNAEYPDWLRAYYAGARFSTSLSNQSSERYPGSTVVEMVVVLASGETASAHFVMEPAANVAGWKIVDQLN